MLSNIPIILKFFPANRLLLDYVDSLSLLDWHPDFIVLHNTGDPTLPMRPHGFDRQMMVNLSHYYASLDWHSGPHFFVDQNGVWVFSNPEKPGVHSPSWNKISWGVEMLGDYQTDLFNSGNGLLIQSNAVYLLAALSKKAGLQSSSLRLHRWDPLTTHKDCPGQHVDVVSIVLQIHNQLEAWRAFRADAPDSLYSTSSEDAAS